MQPHERSAENQARPNCEHEVRARLLLRLHERIMPQAGLSHCAWTHRLRVCSVCCTVPWREDRHSVERAGLPAPSRKTCAPSQPATSATGLDSPLLHLHRDWELCSHPSSPRLRSLLLSLPPGWHSCMPSRGMRNGTGPSRCKMLIVLKIAASACRRSARRAAASSQASSKRIVTASSSAPLHKADSQQQKSSMVRVLPPVSAHSFKRESGVRRQWRPSVPAGS